ncbi:glycosyltransferase [Escherichia coli]
MPTIFNPQEMINKTIIFDERPEASVASSFHVAYGIDQNFLFGCGVSITSVLLHNNDVSFVFHVFLLMISLTPISSVYPNWRKSYHTCIQIHLVNCERLKVLPTTKKIGLLPCISVFVIADYFIDQQDKILYPDADIACQGTLKPLITMDLANNVAAVVTERDANWWSLRAQSLQCNELEKGLL